MTPKHTFISFDFDYDDDLRNALVGQAKYPNSPFEIVDMSVRAHLSGDWEEKVRNRIRRVDLVIVICGEHTHRAEGVATEVKIAQEEGKEYFLLHGRRGKLCTKPMTVLHDDEMYEWTWDNLRKLIEGQTLAESFTEWFDYAWPWILGAAGLVLLISSQRPRASVPQSPWSRDLLLPKPWTSSYDHPSPRYYRPWI